MAMKLETLAKIEVISVVAAILLSYLILATSESLELLPIIVGVAVSTISAVILTMMAVLKLLRKLE
jgi:hypothetical protein